jgi:metal-responsive CopG/Arc/MetJ family transcriptional regulator
MVVFPEETIKKLDEAMKGRAVSKQEIVRQAVSKFLEEGHA